MHNFVTWAYYHSFFISNLFTGIAIMADIIIYTTKICPYCDRAKMLLKQKNAAWTEIDVTADEEERMKMREKAGGRTSVPQIFINGDHIGGCDDLYALNKAGELDALLAA